MGIVFLILLVIPIWKICDRAGFHPALSLLCLLPVVGFFIVVGILAFSEWPASKLRILGPKD